MPAASDSNPPSPAEEKPAPSAIAEAPAKLPTRSDTPTKRPPARLVAGPQQLAVSSSPKGAVVTLDNEPDTACTTPCMLEANPGHHTLEFVKSGFDLERREVEVGASAVELPTVVMRSKQGTLMLTSSPAGASVLVNGQRQTQVTPAQIPLAPGSYAITVEWKDGKKASRTVQVKDGINFEKFVMEQ